VAHGAAQDYDIHVETKSPAAAQVARIIARLFAIDPASRAKRRPSASQRVAQKGDADPLELRTFLDATMEKITAEASLAAPSATPHRAGPR